MKKINVFPKFVSFIFGFVVFAYIYNPGIIYAALPPGFVSPTQVCDSKQGQTFCDGFDVKQYQCDGSSQKVKTCYKSQDQICGEGDCQTLYQSTTTVSPSVPKLGDSVTVTVNGTGTCSQNINFDPGPGLHNPIQYQQPNCDQTSFSCSDKNPPDQSYKCTWVYSCIGFHLSSASNNPIDVPTPFESVFMSSSSSACTSSGQYTVDKPLSCVTDTSKPVTDPNGDNTNNLVAKTLSDDKTFAQAVNMSTLPDNINQQSATECTNAPSSLIGIQLGLSITSSIQSILCNNSLFNFLQGINLLYCPINNNVANNQSNCFTAYTTNINRTTNPDSLKTDPAQRSCYLQDLKIPDKGFTTGDKDLTNNSINAASTNGYYRSNTPSNIQGYAADPINFNASIKSTNIPGELRASDISCAAKEWVDQNFPDKIVPPYLDPNSMGCLTSNIVIPPPGSVTACESKWYLNGNPLGNYGDPACDFNLEGLSSLIKQSEPNPDYFYEYFNVIAACESGYNPDAYNPHSTNGTAWGLFQMNGEPPPPLGGYASEYDHGNVAWQQQATNAINHNRTRNNNFLYWETHDGCPGHPSVLF